ncbi:MULTISPECIES: translocation/assembly module TamB domain-containing protein [unclassified Phenylobacterium]|uniref:translocation/assembly module TamB domain-containing protein n=1 Tax=unclassified Phenylobacterium TaxID=2640670 RepID=UPI00083AC01D|nr:MULTISPECIES: translocation/assembly module TamB domain-containing protein [unclassified Phenylobacterium]
MSAEGQGPPPTRAPRPGRPRAQRWALIGGAVIALLLLLAGLGLAALNTGPGRAFLVERIAGYRTESGLNVRIGRIEGSLFGRMTLHEVSLRDTRGVFARIPEATVDWRPAAVLRRKLDLREFAAPEVRVLRRPALKPTPRDPNKPLLPDIDIAAPDVSLGRIILESPVTGRRHVATLRGSADLADGRAKLDLMARALEGRGLAGGDRLDVKVDVVPAANRLQMDIGLSAPIGGLADSYLGLGKPLIATIDGRGDWKAWRGRAVARLGPQALLDVRLRADDARFRAEGEVRAGAFVQGPASRLLAPAVAIEADGTLKQRRLNGRLTLSSDALTLAAAGAVDLETNRFDDVQVTARLLEAGAVAPNLTGRDVVLALKLDGRLARLLVDYRLSAAMIGAGVTRIEGLRADGRARISPNRIQVPISARAARVTGSNASAGGLLSNLSLTGDVAYSDGRLLTDNLRLRSERLDATAVIVADLRSGRYDGALKGRVNDYAVEGVGRFNLVTDAELTAGREGGIGLRGSVRVNSRRLDNGALRDLLGGQGLLTADVALLPGGQITVANLRLQAPDFRIVSGSGSYRPDGQLSFRAAARSARYGPLVLTADGTAQRPIVRLTAPRPDVGGGLRDVVLEMLGTGQGYRTSFTAQSDYGPLTGQATLRPGRPLAIDISALNAAGVTLAGRLSQAPSGPFVGTLQLSGSGLGGVVRLGAAGAVQRTDIDVSARAATLRLAPVVAIGRGRLTATVLLPEGGPQVSGDLWVADLTREGLSLSAARVRGRYSDGRGDVGFVMRGESVTPFDLAGQASLAPRAIRANLRSTVNGVALRLAAPADIRKVDDGWRLAPVRVVLPRGGVVLAGETGQPTRLEARLNEVDLSLARNLLPNLALEGSATGVIDVRAPGGGAMPTASIRLNVEGFSRVALGTESPPVDIAVRGALSPSGGSLDGVVRRGQAAIGRIQARIAPIAPGGDWRVRLVGSPLSGGVRYDGPAGVLWAMTGIAGHDVSGPIIVAADFGGQLRRPTLSGVIRGETLRYENPTYATVVSGIAVRGRFTQSRLEITSLTGRAGSGSVAARGWVGLDAAAGFPMDIRATFDRAQLASSDAIGASVTGAVAVSNGRERRARITGELRIPEARYRIVRQGSADVPVLEGVRRRTSSDPASRATARDAPSGGLPGTWTLDLRVRADNRIFVTGMGLESEWGADLRVRGPADNPIVTGDLDLVRGDYAFAGRRLEVTRAEVRFDGREATNPRIDIAASTTVEGVTATVTVSGRAQDPRIAFTSIPALPQDEVLSRLLFGAGIDQISPTQAVQIAAALNSLRNGGGGANPLGRLRSVAGVDRLRILGGDEATGRGTALAAGTYIGRNVYLEVITDARGFTATQLELALSRTLSLLLQTATLGGSSVQVEYSREY